MELCLSSSGGPSCYPVDSARPRRVGDLLGAHRAGPWSRPACIRPPAVTGSRPVPGTCCCRHWWPTDGVTLGAVATALEIPVSGGTVHAEGELDFRDTLGVAMDAPVGFRAIRLRLTLDTTACEEQLATLVRLTERCCVVVYQPLARTCLFARVGARAERQPGSASTRAVTRSQPSERCEVPGGVWWSSRREPTTARPGPVARAITRA
jgi:hypothetical protein